VRTVAKSMELTTDAAGKLPTPNLGRPRSWRRRAQQIESLTFSSAVYRNRSWNAENFSMRPPYRGSATTFVPRNLRLHLRGHLVC
jgi:hypothetical protein